MTARSPSSPDIRRDRAAVGWLPWVPVAAATAALFWIVPESPFRNLDDPSYWGLLGYAATLTLLFTGRLRGRDIQARRGPLLWFLVGMPVIYLADWLRFGGSVSWLGIELAGAATFWLLARLATTSSGWYLAVGIAGHGLWDLAHFGRAAFVPDWYALGCAVVDVALGLFLAAGLWLRPRR